MLEGGARGAGNKIQEVLEVASRAQRHVFSLHLRDYAAGVGAVGLQRGRGGGDFHAFRNISWLQCEVDAGRAVDLHLHAIALRAFEASLLGGHIICAGGKIGEGVSAGLARSGGARGAGVDFGDGEFGIRNTGSGAIGDGSQKGSRHGLCEQYATGEQQRYGEK